MQKKYKVLVVFVLATIFTLTAQIAIQYMNTHVYIGFAPRKDSIIEVQNERAIALTELEQCKAEKQTAIEAGNQDLFE